MLTTEPNPQPANLWRPPGRKISDIVAAHYGITHAEIRGDSRRKMYITPRHVGMYLCVRHAGMSFPYTGRVFNRDHTTVLYGVERIERLCAACPEFAAEVAKLAKQIEAAP